MSPLTVVGSRAWSNLDVDRLDRLVRAGDPADLVEVDGADPGRAGRVGDRGRHAGDVGREERAELEGTDVEERLGCRTRCWARSGRRGGGSPAGRARRRPAHPWSPRGSGRACTPRCPGWSRGRGSPEGRTEASPPTRRLESGPSTRAASAKSAGGLIRIELMEERDRDASRLVADAARGVEDLRHDRQRAWCWCPPSESSIPARCQDSRSARSGPRRSPARSGWSWKFPLAGLRNCGSPKIAPSLGICPMSIGGAAGKLERDRAVVEEEVVLHQAAVEHARALDDGCRRAVEDVVHRDEMDRGRAAAACRGSARSHRLRSRSGRCRRCC